MALTSAQRSKKYRDNKRPDLTSSQILKESKMLLAKQAKACRVTPVELLRRLIDQGLQPCCVTTVESQVLQCLVDKMDTNVIVQRYFIGDIENALMTIRSFDGWQSFEKQKCTDVTGLILYRFYNNIRKIKSRNKILPIDSYCLVDY